jgi:hypothetical protein
MKVGELTLAQKVIAGIVIVGGAIGASALVFAYLAYFIGQQSVTSRPVDSPETSPSPIASPNGIQPSPGPSNPGPGIPIPSPNLLTPISPSPSSPASNPPTTPGTSPTSPGSNPGSSQAKVQETLKGFFAKQTGVQVQSIACPPTIQATAGSSFECQVSAENITFPIQVQVRSNQGDYRVEAKGLLVLAQLEQQIQTTVKEKTGVGIKANCGARLRMTKAGETFQCQAISEQGQTKPVIVTVEDDKGSIRWRI